MLEEVNPFLFWKAEVTGPAWLSRVLQVLWSSLTSLGGREVVGRDGNE